MHILAFLRDEMPPWVLVLLAALLAAMLALITVAAPTTAVDDRNEQVFATWNVSNTTSQTGSLRVVNVTTGYKQATVATDGPVEAEFIAGEWSLYRFKESSDWGVQIWDPGAGEHGQWVDWNASPGADESDSYVDGQCNDETSDTRWMCWQGFTNWPPADTDQWVLDVSLEVGHGSLQSNTFVGATYTVNGTEGFVTEENRSVLDTHDHSLASLSETQTNEFLLWGAVTLFGLYEGYYLVGLGGLMGFFRPLVEGWPISFEFAAVFTFLAFWGYFIAANFRLRDAEGGLFP